MPWKGEKDPYRIWISEIILQQTRVEQGLKYYQAFTGTFPDIRQLAAAPEEQVFKLWEGLGYYSRCRNLLHTARYISRELEGRFPSNHAGILALKGVGPYTAAAIASFAFNLPHAVVDGNVVRVLARYFGIKEDVSLAATKRKLEILADRVLDRANPAAHNQAIMDFGATVCRPANPSCSSCSLRTYCIAHLKDQVQDLPHRPEKSKVRSRWFYYFVFSRSNSLAIRRRSGKDIWRQLHEFLLAEEPGPLREEEIPELVRRHAGKRISKFSISPVHTQTLTHQRIHARFIEISTAGSRLPEGLEWVSREKLDRLAFPRLLRLYLDTREGS